MSPNIFVTQWERSTNRCNRNTEPLPRKHLQELGAEPDKQLIHVSNREIQKVWLMIDKHLSPNGELLDLGRHPSNIRFRPMEFVAVLCARKLSHTISVLTVQTVRFSMASNRTGYGDGRLYDYTGPTSTRFRMQTV